MVGNSCLLHVYLYSQVHRCCCSYWQQLLGVLVNKDFKIIYQSINEILHNMVVCESVCTGSLVAYTFVEQCKKNFLITFLKTCIHA